MPILDANVILRYLLGDIPDQAEKAKEAVMAGASTTTEVLAEVVVPRQIAYEHMAVSVRAYTLGTVLAAAPGAMPDEAASDNINNSSILFISIVARVFQSRLTIKTDEYRKC